MAGLGSNCSLCEEEECSQIAQVSLGTYGGGTCWKQLCEYELGAALPESNCVKLQPLARSSVLYCVTGSLAKFQRSVQDTIVVVVMETCPSPLVSVHCRVVALRYGQLRKMVVVMVVPRRLQAVGCHLLAATAGTGL